MDFCQTCQRQLNGALNCPGCGQPSAYAWPHEPRDVPHEGYGTRPLPDTYAVPEARHTPEARQTPHSTDLPEAHHMAGTAEPEPGDVTGGPTVAGPPAVGARTARRRAAGRSAHRRRQRGRRRRIAIGATLTAVLLAGLVAVEVGNVGVPGLDDGGSVAERQDVDERARPTPTDPATTPEPTHSTPVHRTTGPGSPSATEPSQDASGSPNATPSGTSSPSEQTPTEPSSKPPASPAPTSSSAPPTTPSSTPTPTRTPTPRPTPTEDDCWWLWCR